MTLVFAHWHDTIGVCDPSTNHPCSIRRPLRMADDRRAHALPGRFRNCRALHFVLFRVEDAR